MGVNYENMFVRFVILLCFLHLHFAYAALPPSAVPNVFKDLMKDRGDIVKHSFEIQSSNFEWTYFSGKVTLSGVLVAYTSNRNAKIVYQFFPDYDLEDDLYDTTQPKSRYRFMQTHLQDTEFHPLTFGILLDINTKMPDLLKQKIFGKVGVRAKVTLKDYKHFARENREPQSYATLIDFQPLSDIRVDYRKSPNPGDNYDFINRAYFGTNDSYINLRATPSGQIITKIFSKDMKCDNSGAKIYLIFPFELGDSVEDFEYKLKNATNPWIEAFYLPPHAKDGKEAIYGFIHNSQISVKCKLR